MTERMSRGLELVYGARSPEALNSAYRTWATDYDRDTLASGYCLPFLITAWIARHVTPGSGPLLDAGCGTGLSGPYLRALGFDDVQGLDFSPEMLEFAAQRGAYSNLQRATLGETLPWADGQFAGVFSTGVFTEGHAPASSLRELCRITRSGGRVIFTVRDVIFDRDGFAAVIAELVEAGRWRMVEESHPFRAFAIDEPDVLAKAYVYEPLG